MTKILRTPTATGQVVRFDPPGPAPVPADDWPHKGETPAMERSERGAHVSRLVEALNGWWGRCHGRSTKAEKAEAVE